MSYDLNLSSSSSSEDEEDPFEAESHMMSQSVSNPFYQSYRVLLSRHPDPCVPLLPVSQVLRGKSLDTTLLSECLSSPEGSLPLCFTLKLVVPIPCSVKAKAYQLLSRMRHCVEVLVDYGQWRNWVLASGEAKPLQVLEELLLPSHGSLRYVLDQHCSSLSGTPILESVGPPQSASLQPRTPQSVKLITSLSKVRYNVVQSLLRSYNSELPLITLKGKYGLENINLGSDMGWWGLRGNLVVLLR